MTSPRDRLVRLVAEAREPLGLRRQVDFVKASGLSKSTVHRFEQGEAVDAETLRTISETVKWTVDSAQRILAGGEPTPAGDGAEVAQPYRREPVSEGDLAALIHSVVFEAVIAAAPDTPVGRIREIEEHALEVARQAGYGPPRRRQTTHIEDDSGP